MKLYALVTDAWSFILGIGEWFRWCHGRKLKGLQSTGEVCFCFHDVVECMNAIRG